MSSIRLLCEFMCYNWYYEKKALNKIEIFNKIHLIETSMIEIKVQRIVELNVRMCAYAREGIKWRLSRGTRHRDF